MIDWNLIFACFAISCLSTYLFWCWFRVWYLRQRLFMIRDELWDTMRAEGRLDDPEHREFREAINALIRVASSLSLVSSLYLLLSKEKDLRAMGHASEHKAILKARRDVFLLCAKYLLLESIPGLLITAGLIVFGIWQLAFEKIQNTLETLFDSAKLRNLQEAGLH